ncbi:MAG: hypothetical protein LM580_00380 [Thermofilum sp.]|nr:hypothetical protein [Thermofilum sp.]
MEGMGKREVVCPKCGYRWVPRVERPKRCPRCGHWLAPRPNRGGGP